ncbi:MAG: hypothetical protein RMY64_02320 [Nostoc sp. DedQUE08]|nr:hypothetical protein [Nostoc sp. DedQUE08]
MLKLKTEISYFGMRLLRHTTLRHLNRHAFYKTDTNLQADRAVFPWIVTWELYRFADIVCDRTNYLQSTIVPTPLLC